MPLPGAGEVANGLTPLFSVCERNVSVGLPQLTQDNLTANPAKVKTALNVPQRPG